MIVADTNLVLYLLVRGESTPAAEVVRAEDHLWMVPPLFRYEFIYVLTKYVRDGRLDRDESIRLFRRGMAVVNVSEYQPDPVLIVNLSMNSGCSSYDMEFVALAIELGVQLVTSDQQVIRGFSDIAVQPSQV